MVTREELAVITGRPLIENLLYGEDWRQCSWPSCKQNTRWRKRRQPKYGTCPEHALPRPMDPDIWRQARRVAARHFPGGTWIAGPFSDGEPVAMTNVRIEARDPLGLVAPFVTTVAAYPPEAGPCQLCGTFIRRGGYGAAKLCRSCRSVAA